MAWRAREDFLWFKVKQEVPDPQDNWRQYIEEVSQDVTFEPAEKPVGFDKKPGPAKPKKKGRRGK